MRYIVTENLDRSVRKDWQAVSSDFEDPFIDLRMIDVVRETFDQCRIWHVIIYDEHDRPVAVACFFCERSDAVLMSRPQIRRMTAWVRRVLPKFLWLPTLFCGLPASYGWNQLRIRAGTDVAAVVATLDRAQDELRRATRAAVTVVMEFDDQEAQRLAPFVDLGYSRADSTPMFILPAEGRTFDEYIASMKSRYRCKITHSRRKFSGTGIRVVHCSGAEGFADLYTDQMHDLYLQVVRHAERVVHTLPTSYFRAIANHFGSQFVATIAYEGTRPVGFVAGLFSATAYYPLFVGFDYELNERTDLYFNLTYDSLSNAMQRRVERTYLGSASDLFKLRLGSIRDKRSVFVRLHGLLDRPFRKTARLWMPEIKNSEVPMEVFGGRTAAANEVS